MWTTVTVLCRPSAQLRAAPDVRQPAWGITISAQSARWWVGQRLSSIKLSDDDSSYTNSLCSCVQFMAAMELMGAPSAVGPSFLPESTGPSVLLQDLKGELQHTQSVGSKPPLNEVGGPFWTPDRGGLVCLPSLHSDDKRPITMQHARNLRPACCVHPCLQNDVCCWLSACRSALQPCDTKPLRTCRP